MPGTEDLTVAELLLLRAEWVVQAVGRAAAARGVPPLTPAQARLVDLLGEAAATAPSLAGRLGVSRQAVQQVVASLVAEGLVELRREATDRRLSRIGLTDRGTEVLAAVAAARLRVDDELRLRLGPLRTRELRAALATDWGPGPQG